MSRSIQVYVKTDLSQAELAAVLERVLGIPFCTRNHGEGQQIIGQGLGIILWLADNADSVAASGIDFPRYSCVVDIETSRRPGAWFVRDNYRLAAGRLLTEEIAATIGAECILVDDVQRVLWRADATERRGAPAAQATESVGVRDTRRRVSVLVECPSKTATLVAWFAEQLHVPCTMRQNGQDESMHEPRGLGVILELTELTPEHEHEGYRPDGFTACVSLRMSTTRLDPCMQDDLMVSMAVHLAHRMASDLAFHSMVVDNLNHVFSECRLAKSDEEKH